MKHVISFPLHGFIVMGQVRQEMESESGDDMQLLATGWIQIMGQCGEDT